MLLLSGALATTIGQPGCRPDEPQPPAPIGTIVPANQLVADRDQDNNFYVPGVGYYHSVYHTWAPYPFNWYAPGHGYFYAGHWQPNAYSGPIPLRSRPLPGALSAALNMIRRNSESAAWAPSGGGGHGFGFGSSGGEAATSGGISRGGFGSSAHGGGGE